MRTRFLLAAAGLCLGLSARAEDSKETVKLGDVPGAMAQAREAAPMTPAVPAKPQIPDDPWKRVMTPSHGPAEAIGGYSAGCLKGAEAIELTGHGFQLMRLSRKRYYGHPDLLAYIRAFGSRMRSSSLGSLLVGDMAQPRGGPTMSGHASHQTGLDADVWYLTTPSGTILSDKEREKLNSPTLVIGDFDGLTKDWSPKVMDLLKRAVDDAKVERIFVNPAIKKEICARHNGEAWLGKLRPWWGHADHFHVRLSCPADAPDCRHQETVPAGDGCGSDLAEWFTPEKKKEAEEMRKNPSAPTMPKLPPRCDAVLTAP